MRANNDVRACDVRSVARDRRRRRCAAMHARVWRGFPWVNSYIGGVA